MQKKISCRAKWLESEVVKASAYHPLTLRSIYSAVMAASRHAPAGHMAAVYSRSQAAEAGEVSGDMLFSRLFPNEITARQIPRTI
jgi:hypothetical protein